HVMVAAQLARRVGRAQRRDVHRPRRLLDNTRLAERPHQPLDRVAWHVLAQPELKVDVRAERHARVRGRRGLIGIERLGRIERLVRPFRKTGVIQQPARTVHVASLGPTNPARELRRDHHMAHFWRYGDGTPDSVPLGRHGGGEGYLFLDGHAEVLRFEDTLDLEREVDRWDPEGF
ncbi:MAG: hypothetical protein AAGJ54_13725, partial [Planctomycetota bacterium]